MQGQRSAIGSLPDSLNFDFGSTPPNVGMDQQLRWNNLRDPLETRPSEFRIAPGSSDSFLANINQEGPSLSRWSIGDPVSSTSFPNPMNHEERIIQNGWSSSMSSSASGPSLRSEEPIPELPSVFSRNSVNLNLDSNQIPNGPAFYRTSNPGSSVQDVDINARLSGYVGGGADLMECSDPSKSGVLEPRMAPSSSGPSEPFASSSGSGGFLVEDEAGRPGSSMDRRRMSCKRKTLEGNSGQSSASASCFSREGGIWQAAPPPTYNIGGSSLNLSSSSETALSVRLREAMDQRLALSMGGISSGYSIPPTNVGVGAGDNSATTYPGRTNVSNAIESFPTHLFVPRVSGHHSSTVSTHQPTRLVPVSPPLNLMPQVQPDNTASQNVARFHGLRRNVQSVRWGGGGPSGSRAGAPSDPSAVVSERNVSSLHEDRSVRSMPINPSEPSLLYPSSEARNTPQNPPSWGVNNGRSNAGMPRSLASSSRAGPSAGSHPSSGPNWGSHRHSSSQYSSRLSEYIRRSLLATENGAHGGTVGSSHRAPSQETHIPTVGNPNLFSRPGLMLDRRGDGAAGVPLSLRALAAGGEGRTRLFAEIRNVLDMMRRGETLRVEDVMMLDPSVIFGMADMHDQHRDMRLDVDNMSYEELLALEERIGNVCTGLTEEMIMSRMKRRKYIWMGKDNPLEQEPCCICQEEYCLGEDLGTLDCGHDFHTKCIKQWLGQKNLCPICKTTGLIT